MASTSDCKKLLDSHPETAGQGPWVRRTKRKDGADQVRVFSNKDETCFALLRETPAGALSVDRVAEAEDELDVPLGATMSAKSSPLFQKYPPVGLSDIGGSLKDFSGAIVFGGIEEDETFGEGVQFMCTYQTTDGYMYDQHTPNIDQMLEDLFGATYGSLLSLSDSEGTHSIGPVPEAERALVSDDIRRTLLMAGALPFAPEDAVFTYPALDPNAPPAPPAPAAAVQPAAPIPAVAPVQPPAAHPTTSEPAHPKYPPDMEDYGYSESDFTGNLVFYAIGVEDNLVLGSQVHFGCTYEMVDPDLSWDNDVPELEPFLESLFAPTYGTRFSPSANEDTHVIMNVAAADAQQVQDDVRRTLILAGVRPGQPEDAVFFDPAMDPAAVPAPAVSVAQSPRPKI